MSAGITFTPIAGLLALGDRLATHAGLGELWSGQEGLREVAERALRDSGVPIAIEVSPMTVAEHTGVVKKKRKGRK
jgi:hypothetical protein